MNGFAGLNSSMAAIQQRSLSKDRTEGKNRKLCVKFPTFMRQMILIFVALYKPENGFRLSEVETKA